MLDEKNKMISYRVIDGEMMKLYKNFIKTIQIYPRGEGSLVKFILEYEKASDEAWDPELIKEAAMEIFNKLDVFLLK
ncbi:hypothetical protein LUZ60_006000 [Juncus effusus]|nr:hypothetical protein LUZ60_006000 [Juncus effusus]